MAVNERMMSVDFEDVFSPEDKDAILGCPGYGDTLRVAKAQPFECWGVKYSNATRSCLMSSCDVLLAYVPPKDLLVISGSCPKAAAILESQDRRE